MNETNAEKEDKIHSLRGYFLYSLGAVPSALPYQMVGSYFLLFYSVYAGLDIGLVGVIIILYGIWNAVNDPLIGYYMDKKKTKWGRRVPYIVVGTVPFTIGAIFLWWVPWTDTVAVFLHALLMLFIFDFGFSIVMTAWSALFTEMYQTEKERSKVVAIKDTMAFFASMIGTMIPPMIADALGWPIAGLIFGITIPITMYLSLLGTKERKEYQIDEPLPIVMAFKETLKNRPFLIVALTYAMIDFCFGLTMMILPLYAKFVLHLDEGLVGIGAAGVAIGILASVPLWMWIYSNKGPKYGLLTGMIIFAAGIWPIFLLEDVVLLIIITIIPGIGVCGMLMTEPSISAAIDYDELKTSKRREATYNGVLAFVARLSMVLSGITLIIMQLATGLDVNASSQSPTAIFGLKLLVGIIPLAGILLGIVIFRFFPINYTEFVKMQEKLEVMHQERVEKFKSQQK